MYILSLVEQKFSIQTFGFKLSFANSVNKRIREKGQPKFSFHFVTLEEPLKEVALLSDKKASQASDIPIKIIKENRDLIAYLILSYAFHFDVQLDNYRYYMITCHSVTFSGYFPYVK